MISFIYNFLCTLHANERIITKAELLFGRCICKTIDLMKCDSYAMYIHVHNSHNFAAVELISATVNSLYCTVLNTAISKSIILFSLN